MEIKKITTEELKIKLDSGDNFKLVMTYNQLHLLISFITKAGSAISVKSIFFYDSSQILSAFFI